MKSFSSVPLRCLVLVALAVVAPALVGCTKVDPPSFVMNLQGRNPADFQKGVEGADAVATVSTVMYAMFGDPNDPYVLPETGLDARKVQLAAGPSGGDASGRQRGLYRQHCAHCHGISGDGAGPTAAFLNPYPRDYRQGQFKFKSTTRPDKPTDDDLRRILHEGIAGTAMPSFLLLPEDEIDSLVEYVKYLSVRGQTEQMLLIRVLDEGDPIDLATANLGELAGDYLTPIAQTWQEAESHILVPVDPPAIDTPELLSASLAKGAELFRGGKAQCAKCHGPTAMGDGSEELLFDDWNKVKKFTEISKNLAAAKDTKASRDELAKMYEALEVEERSWQLPQQQVQPRNLRQGIYRFGRRPVDMYRRIFAGINGTPMPQGGADASNPSGLTGEEIWHIVNYVRTLPYEKMSDPQVGKGRLAGMGSAHE